jgi:DNA helicase-2/ATP-dependent DNA helicase PcrA
LYWSISAPRTNRNREHRLLYVAMTRAKDALGDRHSMHQGRRFIPENLLELFEQTAWPLAANVR